MKRKITTLIATILCIVSFGTTTVSANPTDKNAKPFLIQNGLPHLTKSVAQLWDDKDFALTKEQKEMLLPVRKETLSQVKQLAKEIINLESKIIKSSNEGVEPSKLEKDVKRIANLRAKATMVHLECLYKTKKVLTKKQLSLIKTK